MYPCDDAQSSFDYPEDCRIHSFPPRRSRDPDNQDLEGDLVRFIIKHGHIPQSSYWVWISSQRRCGIFGTFNSVEVAVHAYDNDSGSFFQRWDYHGPTTPCTASPPLLLSYAGSLFLSPFVHYNSQWSDISQLMIGSSWILQGRQQVSVWCDCRQVQGLISTWTRMLFTRQMNARLVRPAWQCVLRWQKLGEWKSTWCGVTVAAEWMGFSFVSQNMLSGVPKEI